MVTELLDFDVDGGAGPRVAGGVGFGVGTWRFSCLFLFVGGLIKMKGGAQ